MEKIKMKKEKNKKEYKSRVEKNSTKNRLKRRIKKNLKRLPKEISQNTLYIIVGAVYTIYLVIRGFDNLIVKLFMKLPRISRAIILWVLVISNVYHNFDFKTFTKEVEHKEITINTQITPKEETTILEEIVQDEPKQEEVYQCSLEHETSCKIQNKAIQYGIDWRIAVAISRWETGNYTSSLYHNKNNVGGLYCKGFLSYKTLDEGIEAFVSNLKRNYFDMGLDTLEEIQKKYCPIGADNDPNNLNKNWLGGVTKIYQSLEGK
jgi:hypothetical protein